MPWLRSGDDAAMYPKLLSVVANANFDGRLINEVAGFLWRSATQSANFITDYVLDIGTAYTLAGDRLGVLTDACVQAGLMEVVDMNGVRGWKIIEDPEFLHMKTEEEIAWERQRKQDNGNPALIIPVRLRDGDACRYCGKVVKWTARKGKLAGTYDHREPGQAATVDTLVVCCGECNAKRGNDQDADSRVPLLPKPVPPYFDKTTIEWINNSTWARENGVQKLPPKRDKYVPFGSVPPGHESHVPVPGELLIESPVETNADAIGANGHGLDSQQVPPMPAHLGAADPKMTTSASQVERDGIDGVATKQTTVPATGDDAATADPGSASPASNGGRGASGRSASQQSPRQRNSVRPVEKIDLPKKSDPAGGECAGSGLSGSGRDGTVRVGNGEVGDGDVSADGEKCGPKKKRHRRRGKKKGR